jgi:hypothetical protein
LELESAAEARGAAAAAAAAVVVVVVAEIEPGAVVTLRHIVAAVAAAVVAACCTDRKLGDHRSRGEGSSLAGVVVHWRICHLASGQCNQSWSDHTAKKGAASHLQPLPLGQLWQKWPVVEPVDQLETVADHTYSEQRSRPQWRVSAALGIQSAAAIKLWYLT